MDGWIDVDLDDTTYFLINNNVHSWRLDGEVMLVFMLV